VAGSEKRTPDQIKEEIRAERLNLAAARAELAAGAERSARVGGSALAALGGLLLAARLRRGRRRAG
jgi:NaMN:DMB phosphoribosyltransferase